MKRSCQSPAERTGTKARSRESSRWLRRESIHGDLERGRLPGADFRCCTSKADCRRRRIANSEGPGLEKRSAAAALSAGTGCSIAVPCRKNIMRIECRPDDFSMCCGLAGDGWACRVVDCATAAADGSRPKVHILNSKM